MKENPKCIASTSVTCRPGGPGPHGCYLRLRLRNVHPHARGWSCARACCPGCCCCRSCCSPYRQKTCTQTTSQQVNASTQPKERAKQEKRRTRTLSPCAGGWPPRCRACTGSRCAACPGSDPVGACEEQKQSKQVRGYRQFWSERAESAGDNLLVAVEYGQVRAADIAHAQLLVRACRTEERSKGQNVRHSREVVASVRVRVTHLRGDFS
jgi:hypothetical protein